MGDTDARVVECLRLLEEHGDLTRCLELYPDLASELAGQLAISQMLSAVSVPSTAGTSQAASRRQLMSSLSQTPGGMSMLQRFVSGKAAALAAGLALFVVGAVGAGAASGSFSEPMSEVLSAFGVGEETHGQAVSDAVHEAIDTTEPGPERGLALSLAACEAAHDRSTLPESAQNTEDASTEEADEAEDADKCKDEAVEEELSEDEVLTEEAVEGEDDAEDGNHGSAVSDAVHQAQEETAPGPERGRAVSEAACEAAQDRSTLPEKAKKTPPGRDNKPEKDCTHPNSEDDSDDED